MSGKENLTGGGGGGTDAAANGIGMEADLIEMDGSVSAHSLEEII